jgi:hypothetical protein
MDVLIPIVTRFKPLESLHTYFHSKKYGLMHRFEEAIIYERRPEHAISIKQAPKLVWN